MVPLTYFFGGFKVVARGQGQNLELQSQRSRLPFARRDHQSQDLFLRWCPHPPCCLYYLCTYLFLIYLLIYCAVIQHMGKKLHLRQRVVATASIYFRRLYLTYTASSSPLRTSPHSRVLSVGVRRSSYGGGGWSDAACCVCRNSFVEYDPRLFAPGCLYLASKIEECMTHAKQFASQANEISTSAHEHTPRTRHTHARHVRVLRADPLCCVCAVVQ